MSLVAGDKVCYFCMVVALLVRATLSFDATTFGRTFSIQRQRDVSTPTFVGKPKGSSSFYTTASTSLSSSSSNEAWKGDVVSNTADGKISGCKLQKVEGSLTTWVIYIDGVEADLGRFSEAIYKKMMSDAKQQRFQGFRPGTVPPHIEPTYRAFTMDECARETVLEAMQQNNIRPFADARTEMQLEEFRIPPPAATKKRATNKSKKRKKPSNASSEAAAEEANETEDKEEPVEWLKFATMKEAIDKGWRPGQSFSFVARNVKGQVVKDDSETAGATPLGLNY